MQISVLDIIGKGVESEALYAGNGMIMKRPQSYIVGNMRQEWLQRQTIGSLLASNLQHRFDLGYKIPYLHDIDGRNCYIIESMAQGEPVTSDYFACQTKNVQEQIIHAFCTFCNAMHQSSRVDYGEANYVPKHFANKHFLFTKKYFPSQIKKIEQAIDWLSGLKHYQTSFVFGITDINPSNILHDKCRNDIWFVDFAGAINTNMINDAHTVLLNKFAYYCNITNQVKSYYLSLPKRYPVTLDNSYNIPAGHLSEQINLLAGLIDKNIYVIENGHLEAAEEFSKLVSNRIDRVLSLIDKSRI